MGLSMRELLLLQIKSTADTGALQATQQQIRQTGLAAAQSSLKLFGMSHAFQQIGAGMQRFGAVMTAGTVVAGKFAADFEHQMAVVRTQTDFTATEFDRIEDAILRVSTNTARPLSELEEGLFDIFSTIDASIPQAIGALRLLGKAAVAGDTDIRTSSRSAIAMLNAYGMGVDKLNKVLDIQFQLVRFGAGTYEEIASAIGMALPSSVAAGQSLKTLSGVLAFLTRNGLSASEAVTAASRAMDLLTRPEIGAKMEKVLGIEVVDKATGKFKQIDEIMTEMATTGGLAKMSEPERAKVFEEIFGAGEIRANRFFKTAIPRFEELNALIGRTAQSSGAMNRAFKIVGDTFTVKWGKFVNTLKVFAITLGNVVLPILDDFLKVGQGIIDWFENLSPATKKLLGELFAFSGLFLLINGTVLKMVGSFMSLVSILRLAGLAFGSASLAAGGIILAITAIATAVFLIIKNWDQFSAWWDRNWETIKMVVIGVVSVITVLLVQKLGGALATAGSKVATFGSRMVTAGGRAKAFGRVMGGVNSILSTIAWAVVVGGILSILDAFREARQMGAKFFESMRTKGGNAVEHVIGKIDDFREQLHDLVGSDDWFKFWQIPEVLGLKEKIAQGEQAYRRYLNSVAAATLKAIGYNKHTSESLRLVGLLADELNGKQRRAMLTALELTSSLGGKVNKLTLFQVANLIAVGDVDGALKLLTDHIKSKVFPGLQNLQTGEEHAKEAAADLGQKVKFANSMLDKMFGSSNSALQGLKNLLPYEIIAAEKAADLGQKLAFANGQLDRLGGGHGGGGGGSGGGHGGSGGGGNTGIGGNPGPTPDRPNVQINVNERLSSKELARELNWVLRTSM